MAARAIIAKVGVVKSIAQKSFRGDEKPWSRTVGKRSENFPAPSHRANPVEDGIMGWSAGWRSSVPFPPAQAEPGTCLSPRDAFSFSAEQLRAGNGTVTALAERLSEIIETLSLFAESAAALGEPLSGFSDRLSIHRDRLSALHKSLVFLHEL